MDEKELDELRSLIEFLKANGISEFEMDRPDGKVRIKFAGSSAAPGAIDAAQVAQLLGGGQRAVIEPLQTSAAAGEAAPVEAEEKLHDVKSPIVGTFYESPSPGAPPFVKIGDTIEVGQVLCIVEAMKLMNEVESDVAGEVVRRIANSGQPVEYGQPLFAIRTR